MVITFSVNGCMFLFCYMLSILLLSVVFIYEINVEKGRFDFDLFRAFLNPSYNLQSSLTIFSLDIRLLVNIKYVIGAVFYINGRMGINNNIQKMVL